MQTIEFFLKNEGELESLAAKISRLEVAINSIYLSGDLGAGKTTFSRGYLQGLGYTGLIKSPTYTLVEPYQISGITVYHIDLYRLTDPEELEFAGLRDLFDESSMVLVEWPERAAEYLPEAQLCCLLSYQNSGRKLTISCKSKSHFDAVSTLC